MRRHRSEPLLIQWWHMCAHLTMQQWSSMPAFNVCGSWKSLDNSVNSILPGSETAEKPRQNKAIAQVIFRYWCTWSSEAVVAEHGCCPKYTCWCDNCDTAIFPVFNWRKFQRTWCIGVESGHSTSISNKQEATDGQGLTRILGVHCHAEGPTSADFTKKKQVDRLWCATKPYHVFMADCKLGSVDWLCNNVIHTILTS